MYMFKFKNLNERIDTAAEILGIDKTTLNALETNNRAKTEKNLFENETNKYVISGNIRLIQIESGDYIDSTLEMVFCNISNYNGNCNIYISILYKKQF